MIDIRGLNKPELAQYLLKYALKRDNNNEFVTKKSLRILQEYAFWDRNPEHKNRTYIDLNGDYFDETFYDSENGIGLAEKCISDLREKYMYRIMNIDTIDKDAYYELNSALHNEYIPEDLDGFDEYKNNCSEIMVDLIESGKKLERKIIGKIFIVSDRKRYGAIDIRTGKYLVPCMLNTDFEVCKALDYLTYVFDNASTDKYQIKHYDDLETYRLSKEYFKNVYGVDISKDDYYKLLHDGIIENNLETIAKYYFDKSDLEVLGVKNFDIKKHDNHFRGTAKIEFMSKKRINERKFR